MRSALKEPLVHFLLAGVLLFAFNAWWQARAERMDRTIHVTKADMQRMAAVYTAQSGSPPPAQAMQTMVADHVREKVLVREAQRLGLGEGDTVVDRRLAQKMTFMIADLSELGDPSEEELLAWHKTNAERFLQPARVTFQHVFIAENSTRDPEEILVELNENPAADWENLSEPFMLQSQYRGIPRDSVERLFGNDFSTALFELPSSPEWQGPVTSSFGAHLVRIEKVSAEFLPPLNEIRAEVLADWRSSQSRLADSQAIADLIRSYDIIIEGVTN